VPDHVLADAGLPDVDAELQQFAVNVGSAPQWIFAAQHADQLANLFRHRGTAGLAMANLSAPEQAKALPLPADHRSGPDGNAGLPPFQIKESHAQSKRSAGFSFGRLTERWSTPRW
jgi:hypothetical protein